MSLLNVSFNDKTTFMVCCTDTGCIIYKLHPTIEKKNTMNKFGGVGLMKILGESNLSIICGGGKSPYKPKNILEVWDEREKKTTVAIKVDEPILNGIIKRDKFIAILEKNVYIFNHDGETIETKQTYSNKDGLCVVSNDDDKPIIILPGTRKGEVAIWKVKQDSYRTIAAHQNNLSAIAINHDGSLFATASESGTLIKVFSTLNGEQKYIVRRGTTTNRIHDIAFSWDSKYLACCSENNGTIHIFDIDKKDEESKNMKSMLVGTKDWIPELFGSSYVGSQWSFKKHYTNTTKKMFCEFDEYDNLHVCTLDGMYYRVSGADYEDIISRDIQINTK